MGRMHSTRCEGRMHSTRCEGTWLVRRVCCKPRQARRPGWGVHELAYMFAQRHEPGARRMRSRRHHRPGVCGELAQTQSNFCSRAYRECAPSCHAHLQHEDASRPSCRGP